MRCLEVERACMACVDCRKPCSGANTPRISGLEPGETMLRGWSHQVITAAFGEFKERFCYHAAYGVAAAIAVISVALSIAIPPRHWVAGATVERLAKDVFTWIHEDGRGVVIDEGLFAEKVFTANSLILGSCRRWVLR